MKWQIWTALLTYLLLRLVGWIAEWKHSFHRLYTFIRSMLWSRRDISNLLKSIDSPFENKPPPPPTPFQVNEQLEFDFD